jgi:hypothetical protein
VPPVVSLMARIVCVAKVVSEQPDVPFVGGEPEGRIRSSSARAIVVLPLQGRPTIK